jgi:hypothetical protein
MKEAGNEEKRIMDDIRMLDESLAKLDAGGDKRVERIMDQAKRYRDDAGYYLHKKDYVTSFGCINYAHGLLDALLKY